MRLLLAAVVCCVLVAAVTDSDPNDLSERSGKSFAAAATANVSSRLSGCRRFGGELGRGGNQCHISPSSKVNEC